MTPKMTLTSTALSLILAAASTPALAQTNQSGSNASGDNSMAQLIEEADAPDRAETDPVNETASNEIGGSNGMAGQNQPMIIDLQSMSHDIYERGFRQGYIRGVQEARQNFERRIQQMAQQGLLDTQRGNAMNGQNRSQDDMRGHMQGQMGSMQGYRHGDMHGQPGGTMQNRMGGSMQDGMGRNGSNASNQQSNQRMGSGDMQGNQQNAQGQTQGRNTPNAISGQIAARPGGSIVILPNNVSAEQFIEQLVDGRQASGNRQNQ